jgi:hypothetical protein
MHDRCVRRSESCPQLEDTSREPDHLSMIFATHLERSAGLEATAVATREDRPLKVGRRGAEPALASDSAQPLVEIHRKVPSARKYLSWNGRIAQNWALLKADKC